MILCPDCHGHDPLPKILLEDFGLKDIETVAANMEPKAKIMYPKADFSRVTLHQSEAFWLSGERHYKLTTEEDIDEVAAGVPVVLRPTGAGKR